MVIWLGHSLLVVILFLVLVILLLLALMDTFICLLCSPKIKKWWLDH